MTRQFIPKLCKVLNCLTFDELLFGEHMNVIWILTYLGIEGGVLFWLACCVVFLAVTLLVTSVLLV